MHCCRVVGPKGPGLTSEAEDSGEQAAVADAVRLTLQGLRNEKHTTAAAACGLVRLPAAANAAVGNETKAQACQLSVSAPHWAAMGSSAACAVPVLLLNAASSSEQAAAVAGGSVARAQTVCALVVEVSDSSDAVPFPWCHHP